MPTHAAPPALSGLRVLTAAAHTARPLGGRGKTPPRALALDAGNGAEGDVVRAVSRMASVAAETRAVHNGPPPSWPGSPSTSRARWSGRRSRATRR
jgi:hypothetical protein